MVDFAHYEPSYNKPAAFIATPVFDGSELKGIVAAQLNIDDINAFMTSSGNWEQEGMGSSGEVYLVGEDASLRTSSRFLIEGRVVAMDWRSVTIETEQKILAVVPNSELAQSTFVVETSETMPYGEEISLFMAFDDPPEKVIRAIDEVAASIPDVLADPPHEVEVLNYTDKGIEYELMFFVADRGEAWRVRSDFLRRFWYVAKRAGLHHTGAQNLHFQTIKSQPVSFKTRHNMLSKITALTPPGKGFDELATATNIVNFGYQETIMLAGDKFEFIYIPIEGSLSLLSPHGEVIQTLNDGDFYVSRAFLTGSESRVTLRSDEDCRALKIQFQDLLDYTDQNPVLAGRLEQYIE